MKTRPNHGGRAALLLFAASALFGCGESAGDADRAVVSGLNVLRQAEGAYAQRDLAGSGKHDYWTGDVYGLFRAGLIPENIALADAAPLKPLGSSPKPYHGYYFRALVRTEGLAGKEPSPKPRLGWCAYPAERGEKPGKTYLYDIHTGHLFGRQDAAPCLAWPSDAELGNWGLQD